MPVGGGIEVDPSWHSGLSESLGSMVHFDAPALGYRKTRGDKRLHRQTLSPHGRLHWKKSNNNTTSFRLACSMLLQIFQFRCCKRKENNFYRLTHPAGQDDNSVPPQGRRCEWQRGAAAASGAVWLAGAGFGPVTRETRIPVSGGPEVESHFTGPCGDLAAGRRITVKCAERDGLVGAGGTQENQPVVPAALASGMPAATGPDSRS
eukprot:EG_transcript_15593